MMPKTVIRQYLIKRLILDVRYTSVRVVQSIRKVLWGSRLEREVLAARIPVLTDNLCRQLKRTIRKQFHTFPNFNYDEFLLYIGDVCAEGVVEEELAYARTLVRLDIVFQLRILLYPFLEVVNNVVHSISTSEFFDDGFDFEVYAKKIQIITKLWRVMKPEIKACPIV